MKTLYMLVGVPGSGKSTWLATRMFDYNKTVIASTDNYIEKKAEQEGQTYNTMFKDAIKDATKDMNSKIAIAIKNEFDIVWDQTNTNAASRKKKLAQIPNSYKKIAVVFAHPEKAEHERRLANRPGKVIPRHVISNMIAGFQTPTVDEGFDEIIYA